MNERIRELADQAELTVRTSIGTYMSHPEFNKKFAELIIQECCIIAGPEDSYRDDWFSAKTDSVEKIKQHFGVEE